MLRLAAAVGAILLAVTFAHAQTGKHSFSGMCAYYAGRGGGFTAAHKTLPFGTRVRVTDSKTGRSVTGSDCAMIRPPWNSTIIRDNASPNPVPLSLVVTKASNIFVVLCCSRPDPVSCTEIMTSP